MSAGRRLFVALGAALATSALVVPGTATADPGDYGYEGPSYAGSVNSATSDKPQSKLWHVDGVWYADMFDTVSRTWHIFRLNRATEQWVDTGVPIDNRTNTLADTLWDGTHLYVASNVVTVSTGSDENPSIPGAPSRLYRYSYAAGSFTLDAGYPVNINNNSSESLTLDKDTTGRLWATWTQVGDEASDYTTNVYVNSTNGNDNEWGTPFIVPVAGNEVAPDDISTLVAFRNRIGVLWSNQDTETVYFAVHTDGAPTGTWRGGIALNGSGLADDHLNIKTLQSDAAGRVYAAIKTSLDSGSSSPQIMLLVHTPAVGTGPGTWTHSTFGTAPDCHTRPVVMIDDTHQRVHVFATAPTSSGCPHSGAPGSIYMKSVPMSDPEFPPGRGTPIIRDASSANMNDPTSTKQSVNSASGLVVLAANTSTRRYWHADVPLNGQVAPTASFTASPTSGVGPAERAVHRHVDRRADVVGVELR